MAMQRREEGPAAYVDKEPVTEAREIDGQLGRLSGVIEDLNCLVRDLGYRLEPVLRCANPEGVGGAIDKETRTPLGGAIQSLRHEASIVRSCLQDIIDRLEI